MAEDIRKISLMQIKGIGPQRGKLLEEMGSKTVWDMLMHFPRDYRDISHIHHVCDMHLGDVVLQVKIRTSPSVFRKKGLVITSVKARDETGTIKLTWYNQPYIARQLQPDNEYIVIGKAEYRHGEIQIVNPLLEPPEKFDFDVKYLPVYPLAAGLSQKVMRAIIHRCIDSADRIKETLPAIIAAANDLCRFEDAIRWIHFPGDENQLRGARERLAFEEMLLFQIVITLAGKAGRREKGLPLVCHADHIRQFINAMPYPLTGAQTRVLNDIASDLQQDTPMNRLIQGDVGCGKTVLALFTLFIAATEGFQGAFMAPTDILARQHYRNAVSLFAPLGLRVGLFTGSLSAKEREEAKAKILSGEWQIVIGTHALISKDVEYAKLAVAVSDEQHRFGVRQRAALQNKGIQPHTLVMSATPIPRTLALILYGDLDLSIIDEMPPGRMPVKTHCVPMKKRSDMYAFIRKRASGGEQTYVVCPLLEESDEMPVRSAEEVFAELTKAMPDIPAGLLHGRMKGNEKDTILQRFVQGEIKVLVSTTVVEVGVDVKNATVMAVENAERFGLSQLHQLRGRVGRGNKESYCFLLFPENTEACARLEYLASHSNGFDVAEEDLRLRGPGQFLGTQQAGALDFKAASLSGNIEMLQKARDTMQKLLAGEYGEGARRQIEETAKERYKASLEEIAMN
jgi:ATP-dependent DNA helicase RecG